MPYKTDLADEQYHCIQPILDNYNKQFSGKGRPRCDDRPLLNAMLWRLDNGAKWRAVPPEYGGWSTVYHRFKEWTDAGVFAQIVEALQATARSKDRISFDLVAIDGTVVHAHKCAAGAAKKKLSAEKSREKQGLGKSRGGLTTKIVAASDSQCRPLAFVVVPGQRHDSTQVGPVLDEISIAGKPGAPKRRFEKVAADKGFDGAPQRDAIVQRGGVPVIPRRGKTVAEQGPEFDKEAYRMRNVVERLFARLKEFRAIATRYEKLAESYHSFIQMGFMILWLRDAF